MGQNYRRAFDQFSRSTRRSLVLIAFYNMCVIGIHATLLNLYLLRLDYGPAPIGLINSSYAFAIALFSLPAGLVGARLGARRAMLAGLSVQVLSLFLLPLGEIVPASLRLSWFVSVVACGGIGNTFFLVNLTPYLVGVTHADHRTHVFALRSMIDGLAGVGGTVVAGILPEVFVRMIGAGIDSPAPFRWALLTAPSLLLFGLVVGLRTENEPRAAAIRGANGGGIVSAVLFLAGMWLLARLSLGVVQSFFNVYLDDGLGMRPEAVGLIKGVGLAATVPAAFLVPGLVARLRREGVILVALLVLIGGSLTLAFSRAWATAGVGFFLNRASSSLLFAVFLVYSQEIVSVHFRGLISGILYTVAGCGWFLASLGGGVLIEVSGYRSLFLCAAIAAGLAWVLFSLFVRNQKRSH